MSHLLQTLQALSLNGTQQDEAHKKGKDQDMSHACSRVILTLTSTSCGISMTTGWLKPRFMVSILPATAPLYPTPMSWRSFEKPSLVPTTMPFAKLLQSSCLVTHSNNKGHTAVHQHSVQLAFIYRSSRVELVCRLHTVYTTNAAWHDRSMLTD